MLRVPIPKERLVEIIPAEKVSPEWYQYSRRTQEKLERARILSTGDISAISAWMESDPKAGKEILSELIRLEQIAAVSFFLQTYSEYSDDPGIFKMASATQNNDLFATVVAFRRPDRYLFADGMQNVIGNLRLLQIWLASGTRGEKWFALKDGETLRLALSIGRLEIVDEIITTILHLQSINILSPYFFQRKELLMAAITNRPQAPNAEQLKMVIAAGANRFAISTPSPIAKARRLELQFPTAYQECIRILAACNDNLADRGNFEVTESDVLQIRTEIYFSSSLTLRLLRRLG